MTKIRTKTRRAVQRNALLQVDGFIIQSLVFLLCKCSEENDKAEERIVYDNLFYSRPTLINKPGQHPHFINEETKAK